MAFSSESFEQEQEIDTSEEQQEEGEERVQPIAGVIGDAEVYVYMYIILKLYLCRVVIWKLLV